MPELTTIVFLVGLALIVIAAIGGGVEVKEIKVGSLNTISRVFCATFGVVFTLIPAWHPEFIRNMAAAPSSLLKTPEQPAKPSQSPSVNKAPTSYASTQSATSLSEETKPAAPVIIARPLLSSNSLEPLSRVVTNYFAPDRATRLKAQNEFFENWRFSAQALELLVDRCNGDVRNIASVYNVLSTLNRIIPPFIPASDLRAKILQLAQDASINSEDTSRIASSIQNKLK